jgi:carbonic anhydrase
MTLAACRRGADPNFLAGIDALLKTTHEPEHIEALLRLIEPGLSQLDLHQERHALLLAAVEANVRWSMQQLISLPDAQRVLLEKRAVLMGAIYDMATGVVRFLD